MILVTGGTGFLGSYLIRYLIRRGESVRAIRRSTSSTELVASVADKVEWVEGDILDVGSLEDALQGVSKIYHAAAMISFDPRKSDLMHKINIEGTANLVNLALQHPIQKMVYVSSIAAIGRNENDVNVTESSQWQQSKLNSNYAISKFHAECEVWRGIEEGLNAVVVNPSIILGSGFWNRGSCKLFQQVADGLKFYPTGRTGFVDVRDVVKIMVQLMNSSITKDRFILNSENLYYKSLFDLIASKINKKPPDVKVTPFLRGFAWRLEWIKSRLLNTSPLLTRETAITSTNTFIYDNSKLDAAINYSYIPVQETIRETCEQFLVAQKNNTPYSYLPI